MQYRNRYKCRRSTIAIIAVVGLAGICMFRISSAARVDYSASSQQDVLRLESRVNQMEMRLYAIETSLRNLEQRSLRPTVNPPAANREDWAGLRLEIQALQHRLGTDECALAKLDERTLPADTRAARKKSGVVNNPCRMNFDTPLRLPDDR